MKINKIIIYSILPILIFTVISIQTQNEINAIRKDFEQELAIHKHLIDENKSIIGDVNGIIKKLIRTDQLNDEVKTIIDGWGDEWNIGIFEITFNAPLDNQSGICADDDPTTTSTGTYPQQGTFAVDPKLIPYYSDIIVIGDDWVEIGVALDTGGAIRNPEGNLPKIDIFVETYEEGMRRGKQVGVVIWKVN